MIRIITDGACRGNPGPGGWAAIIIADGKVEEFGGHEPHTTNNRMEMQAAIEGLRRTPADAPVHIVTDSSYLMNGITQWISGWRRRGWKTATGEPVLNRELWEELDRLAGKRVTWERVRGHAGHPENERADTIAQSYSHGKTPPPGNLNFANTQAAAPAAAPAAKRSTTRASARPQGTTYLSLVGGELRRHTTWDACRARVSRARGARYKKCRSAEEEIATVEGWGLSAAALDTLAGE